MMFRSKKVFFVLALALAVMVTALPAPGSAKILKIAFVAPPPVWGPVAEKYAEEVAKLCPGLEIKSFGGGQLGPLPQNFAEVKMGKLDMMLADSGVLMIPKGGKDFSVLFAPYTFNSQAHMRKYFASDLFKEMIAKTEKVAGLKFLGLAGDRAPRLISTSSRKVVTPADMKGLKLRVPLTPPVKVAMEAWGATPIPLSAAELYMAMKQGTVDGQDNGFDALYSAKYYEVQKYVSPIDYVRSALMVVISTKVWNKLDPQEQKALQEAITPTDDWATKRTDQMVAEAIEGIKKEGMEVVKPDIAAFSSSAAKIVKDNLDGKLWPAGLYQKIKALD